jgi:hypothetical protein
MDYISPGGTKPKGPLPANYVRYAHLAMVSCKPLRFPLSKSTQYLLPMVLVVSRSTWRLCSPSVQRPIFSS